MQPHHISPATPVTDCCRRKPQKPTPPAPEVTSKAHLDVGGYRPAGPRLAERRGKVFVAVVADEDPFGVVAVLVCSLWSKGARTLLAKRIAAHGVPDAEAAVARLMARVWEETAT